MPGATAATAAVAPRARIPADEFLTISQSLTQVGLLSAMAVEIRSQYDHHHRLPSDLWSRGSEQIVHKGSALGLISAEGEQFLELVNDK